MISRIEFVLYSDYHTSDPLKIITYTNIYDHDYPEEAYSNSVSWFSTSPSSLSFTLIYDQWLEDHIFSHSYDIGKNYLNKYVVLAYNDDEVTPFFTGCIIVDNITVNDNENTISLKCDDFLALLNRISSMELDFSYSDQGLGGTFHVANEPFIFQKLKYVSNFLNFAVLKAETEFWGWGSSLFTASYITDSGIQLSYPGSQPLWNSKYISSPSAGNVYVTALYIYKLEDTYHSQIVITKTTGFEAVNSIGSTTDLVTLESAIRALMTTYGCTSYNQTYLLDGDDLYFLDMYDTVDPTSGIANGNYQTINVYKQSFLNSDYKIARNFTYTGNSKIKYSGVLNNFNSYNATFGIGFKQFAFVNGANSTFGANAEGQAYFEYTLVGGTLTYFYSTVAVPALWSDSYIFTQTKHKIAKLILSTGEIATVIYFGLLVVAADAYSGDVFTSYEKIRTFIGYSEILELETEISTFRYGTQYIPDWWNDAEIAGVDTGAKIAVNYITKPGISQEYESYSEEYMNISVTINGNKYSSNISTYGISLSGLVNPGGYLAQTVKYEGSASNLYFNYTSNPTIETILSNITVINNCYYRCKNASIYIADKKSTYGLATFAILEADMIDLTTSRLLEEEPLNQVNFDVISLTDSKNLLLPIQQFYKEFFGLVFSTRDFELSCVFTDYFALAIAAGTVFSVDSVFSYAGYYYVVSSIQKNHDGIYKISAYNIESTRYNRILSTNGTLSYQGILSIDGINANKNNWIVGK